MMQRWIEGGRGARDAAILLTVVAAFVVSSSSQAALIAEERFLTDATPTGPEFALGTVIGQNPGNPGFTGPWYASNGSAMDVVGTSLTHAGANYPPSAGGSLFSPTDGVRVHRLLGANNPFESSDSGAVYLSFYFQNNSLAGSNHYLAFEMHNGGNSDASRTFQIGASQGASDFPTTTNYGYRVNNQSGLRGNLGTKNTSVNLFLAKFNLSTSANADSVTVWQNPTISSLVTDPTGGVSRSGFDFAADRLGVARFISNSAFDFWFDELRIGTTLEDVLTEFLSCDLNGNGVCNSSDLAILSQNMFLPGSYEDGDIDGSGIVDQLDFRLFKGHPSRVVGADPPGSGIGSLAGNPEPSGVLLGLIAAACLGLVRRRGMPRRLAIVMFAMAAAVAAPPARSAEIDLLNDNINLFSGATLHTRPFTAMPTGFANIVQMSHKPSDTRIFAVTEQGSIFVVNEGPEGATSQQWFNAAAAVQAATGRSMNFAAGQQGLQSIAFHPNFEREGQPGYGKFYTTMLENRPANPNDPAHFYLGNSNNFGAAADGVLAEWTYDHGTGATNSNTYRELFRVNMANYDHPIKLAQFNPYSEPGDEDFGLLYMTHGDSNNQDSLNDDPQDRGDLMGKMIRINPLEDGANRYTIPTTNPFYSGSTAPSPSGTPVLGEMYAYGFRNPHNFSFNPDGAGNVRILVGDIGRSNMEEINLVVPGGNYGWTKREGTFVHLQGSNYPADPGTDNAGYYSGVASLAANEATVGIGPDGNNYIYPVAQYDHNDWNTEIGEDYTASSVAGGFVINNGTDPALQNQYIFHNFAWQNGNVYHADFDELLGAVTQLDPDNPSRDHPSELTQATKYRLNIAYDHDNNPGTPELEYDGLEQMITGSLSNQFDRSDARFGEGISGEMYISSKTSGAIYLVTNTVPDNRLTLNVDRGTGGMTITNGTSENIEVERLRVFSPSGALDPAQLATVDAGWAADAFNSRRDLTQANDSGSFLLTGSNSAELGDAFDPQLIEFGTPPGEDLQFVFETAGPDGRRFVGDVVYTGESDVQHTIVLTVDVASGRASLLNQTPLAQEVDLYTVSSEEGSLNAAGWLSLDAQGIEGGDWIASPADSTRLTEVQEDGTTTFDDATPFDLGSIYGTGLAQDLRVEFLLDGEDALREGEVVYVLAGDYNDDGTVDAVDYTVWRNNLASQTRLASDLTPGEVTAEDYDLWKQNYGTSLPGAGTEGLATSVPEPATWCLALLAAVAILSCRSSR